MRRRCRLAHRAWALALGATLGACAGRVATSTGAGGAVVGALPRFGSRDVIDFAARRGTVIVLDVFASWAEGSRSATAAVSEVARRYGGRSVEFFGVAIDADARFVERYLADAAPAYSVLADPGAQAAEAHLGVRIVPTVLVVGRDGQLRRRFEGYAGSLAASLAAEIDLALAESGTGRVDPARVPAFIP